MVVKMVFFDIIGCSRGNRSACATVVEGGVSGVDCRRWSRYALRTDDGRLHPLIITHYGRRSSHSAQTKSSADVSRPMSAWRPERSAG
jgi:hypothetical protein